MPPAQDVVSKQVPSKSRLESHILAERECKSTQNPYATVKTGRAGKKIRQVGKWPRPLIECADVSKPTEDFALSVPFRNPHRWRKCQRGSRLVVVLYPEVSEGSPGSLLADQSIRATFATAGQHVEIHNEYLELSRIPDESNQRDRALLLRRKYADGSTAKKTTSTFGKMSCRYLRA